VQRLELILQEDWQGMPEDEVLRRLEKVAMKASKSKIVIKKEDGSIWFDETRFSMDKGRLKGVGNL
jgi:Immunity protein 58